jgi:radical SAM superfamily enzyme YgiQ (UPF0313 family)
MNVVLVYRGRYHVREALDLETLAAVLRQGGHEVNLVYQPDTFGVTDNVLQIPVLARLLADDRRTVWRIVRSRPGAVVFSVLSSSFAWCRDVAAAVKQETDAPVIFMGLHPSLVPERVIQGSVADYAIAGEVENVILPLLEAIRSGRDISTVGNLWHRRDGRPVFTHRAELVDLDAQPLPDKDLFAPYVSQRYSYSAMVSRGCPYHCSFCEETCSKKLYGNHYFRRKRVDTVMRELAAGKRKYRFREVIFKDSYLSGNKAWLRELMGRYAQEIAVPFKCFCTILGFDEETARLLKEGGCYFVEFGLQTWNDRVRRYVLNRMETSEDAFRVFEACDRQRLWYDVDHMFDLPNETREDHVLGARCYGRLRRLGRVKVHYLLYYPTADIVDHAIAAGDLPPHARELLAEGNESDFYVQSAGKEQQRRTVAAFAALYKLLPLLPARLREWLLQGDRVRYLRWIPSPLMVAMQGLNALRCGDLRFFSYLLAYPRKILWTLRDRLQPAGRPRRIAP